MNTSNLFSFCAVVATILLAVLATASAGYHKREVDPVLVETSQFIHDKIEKLLLELPPHVAEGLKKISEIALHPKTGQSVKDRLKEIELIAHHKLIALVDAYSQH